MATAEDIRRTSIAAALVSNPGALVVDNPMGDLSHAAGNRIMHALKASLLYRLQHRHHSLLSFTDGCCSRNHDWRYQYKRHLATSLCATFCQAVARRGLTVVAALDGPTPSAYGLLDRVAVLLQGRLIYHGSPGAWQAVHACNRKHHSNTDMAMRASTSWATPP